MSGKPHDFLTSRKEQAQPAEEAQFAWFGPPDADERYRFLIVRESGDDISLLPNSEARFKRGLRAWRYEAAEGGDPEVWVTVKTTARRVDLRRVKV